jgi:hypothetical protein
MLSKAHFFVRDSVAPSVEQKTLCGEFGAFPCKVLCRLLHLTGDGVAEEDFSADIIKSQELR